MENILRAIQYNGGYVFVEQKVFDSGYFQKLFEIPHDYIIAQSTTVTPPIPNVPFVEIQEFAIESFLDKKYPVNDNTHDKMTPAITRGKRIGYVQCLLDNQAKQFTRKDMYGAIQKVVDLIEGNHSHRIDVDYLVNSFLPKIESIVLATWEGQCHKTVCDDNCNYPNCFEKGGYCIELKELNGKMETFYKVEKINWTK